VRTNLTRDAFEGYVRLNRIQKLLRDGRLDRTLRWHRLPVSA
jgi:hypothetical protein